MAAEPPASNWSPPIFLAPSNLLGVVDVAPAPSPLAAAASGSHLPVAGIVGGAVAGAVAVAAVASVVSAVTAGKVGLALLQPAWSLLASLASKLFSPARPSGSSSSFYTQAQDRLSSSARESAIAECQAAKSNYASLQGSAHLAQTAAILEEISVVDPERLKSSMSKYVQSRASAEASKFVAATEEQLEKELVGIRDSAARRISDIADTIKESVERDLSIHTQTLTSKEIVPLDPQDEATTSSGRDRGATHLGTTNGTTTQPTNPKSSPLLAAPNRGGGAVLEEAASEAVRKPAGEVVQAGTTAAGMAPGTGRAVGGAAAAAGGSTSSKRDLGKVRLSMELSAHKLRFFWLCHAGGDYGGDHAASAASGGLPAEASPARPRSPPPAARHSDAPFVVLPVTWPSHYGHLPHNLAGLGAAGPALSSSSSGISIHEVTPQQPPPPPPPPPNPGVNAPSIIREYGCPDYGV